MLTENDVIETLHKHLEANGYKNIRTLTTRQKGVDLIATTPQGKTLYVEAKGETSARVGSKRFGIPFSGNQIWTHVSVALLKTLTTMHEGQYKGGQFAMAFPTNHRELLEKIKPTLSKLEVVVFIVGQDSVDIL